MTAIATWLWQGITVALLTAFALHYLPRLNAATRHMIWWLTLAAVLLLPIVQLAANQPVASLPHDVAARPIAPALVVVPGVSGWLISCVMAIWSSMAILRGVRIASGLRMLVRLKRESRPFDAAREERLTMWMSARRTGRRPELRVAEGVRGACALGLGRPMIVLSPHLASALDEEALDQIVMHEHAHLARLDDWLRLAQATVASVAGLHPAVWFVNRQIDLEREAACDDRVVSHTGAPRRYAACLADAAAVSVGTLAGAVIPGAIASRPMLHVRVGRLLDVRRPRTPRLARAACVASVFLLAGIVSVSTDVRPLVVFLESHVMAPDAAAAPARELPRAGIATDRALGSRHEVNMVPVSSAQSMTRQSRQSPQPPGAASDATLPFATARVVERVETAPPLEGNRLEPAYGAPAAPYVTPLTRPPTTSTTSARDAPWNRAADAGVAIGGFFSRAGKAIARSF